MFYIYHKQETINTKQQRVYLHTYLYRAYIKGNIWFKITHIRKKQNTIWRGTCVCVFVSVLRVFRVGRRASDGRVLGLCLCLAVVVKVEGG